MKLGAKLSAARSYVKSNLGAIGIGASSLVAGAAIGATASSLLRKRKSKSRRRRTSRPIRRKRATGTRKRKRPTASRKRTVSTKRIHYTKTGQPYIKLRSGKARFIKKKSARTSRKRKGGRY